jgi:predicted lipoprotein with Yx(FWY)xxD motif
MKKQSTFNQLLSLSVLATGLSFAGTHYASSETIGTLAPMASPESITIKVIRIGRGVNPPGSNSNQPRDRLVFADYEGNVLYASPEDTTPGVSACIGDCAKTWVPLLAGQDVTPVGYWSVIDRDAGRMQWAFRGKPMYRYVEEMDKPETKSMSSGDYADLGVAKEKTDSENKAAAEEKKLSAEDKVIEQSASARRVPDGQGHEVDGRYVVEIDPTTWMTLPMGITVEEVRAASGLVLSTTKGRSLYYFAGDSNALLESEIWTPVEAGQAVLPVGDFTIMERADGIYQWAFQDKPLYTYSGDREYGDANGLYENDPRFQVAHVMHYFMPDSIQVRKSHTYGGLLETLNGETLYVRERGNGGVDAVYRGDRGRIGIGQSLGIKTCDSTCESTWKPLLAPAGAKPTGYWGLYDRPDGGKQWAYYGYALYTHSGEEEMNSVEVYDDVDHFEVAGDQPNAGIPLHWRVAPP